MKLADFDCRTGAAAVKNRYEKGSEDAAATGKEEQQHSREVDRSRGRIYTSTLGPGDYYNKHNQVMCCHGIRRYRCEDCQQSTIKRPVKRRRVSHGDAAASGKEGQQHSREIDRSRGGFVLGPGEYRDKHNHIMCEHHLVKVYCATCGGTGLCTHGKPRSVCKDCKQSKNLSEAPRDKLAACQEARSLILQGLKVEGGYGSIRCHHKRTWYQCVECKGPGVCEHDKTRSKCPKCKHMYKKRK